MGRGNSKRTNMRHLSGGFSLPEVLVTMAISTIIAAAFATLLTNGLKSQNTVTSVADFNTAVSTIQLVLEGKSTDCGKALVQADGTTPIIFKPASPTKLSSPVGVPKLVLNGNTLMDASVGNKDGGWTNSLEVDKIITNPQPNMYMVNLKYTRILLDRSKAIGVSEHLKNFPLYLNTDAAGNIVSCGVTAGNYRYKLSGIQDTIQGVNIHFAAVNHFFI